MDHGAANPSALPSHSLPLVWQQQVCRACGIIRVCHGEYRPNMYLFVDVSRKYWSWRDCWRSQRLRFKFNLINYFVDLFLVLVMLWLLWRHWFSVFVSSAGQTANLTSCVHICIADKLVQMKNFVLRFVELVIVIQPASVKLKFFNFHKWGLGFSDVVTYFLTWTERCHHQYHRH